jgi:hypothetical protein
MNNQTTDLYPAMLSVLVQDAAGKPCVGCGIPAQYVSVWQPTAECLARDFGFRDGLPRTAVYPICEDCAEKARQSQSFVKRLESTVIKAIKEEWKEGVS